MAVNNNLKLKCYNKIANKKQLNEYLQSNNKIIPITRAGCDYNHGNDYEIKKSYKTISMMNTIIIIIKVIMII